MLCTGRWIFPREDLCMCEVIASGRLFLFLHLLVSSPSLKSCVKHWEKHLDFWLGPVEMGRKLIDEPRRPATQSPPFGS